MHKNEITYFQTKNEKTKNEKKEKKQKEQIDWKQQTYASIS